VSKDESRWQFYVHFESMRDPARDPLLWWTNGGPGSSGLSNLFTGQGPLRTVLAGEGETNVSGVKLALNEYTWSRVANTVYVEQPAGVGFGFVLPNSTLADGTRFMYSDANAAADNWHFIVNFLKRFPHLKANEFYLTSESYGGHYIPTLTQEILSRNKGQINFKGFLLGNPLLEWEYRWYGQWARYAALEYIPKPQWDSYLENECWKVIEKGTSQDIWNPNVSPICNELEVAFKMLAERITDPYALEFPKCRRELAEMERDRDDYYPTYDECAAVEMTAYLNARAVQDALHVVDESNREWKAHRGHSYRTEGGTVYYLQDETTSMLPVLLDIATQTDVPIKMHIISGTNDAMCSTAGDQKWLWQNMALWSNGTYANYFFGKTSALWFPWDFASCEGCSQQLGGYSVSAKLPGGGSFRYSTVIGAGHVIPQTKPVQALAILERFLADNFEDRDE